MSETRKLTAILVADIVGYSRLAGIDEDGTLSRIRGLRSNLINPAVAAHHGRIVKGTGDGVLVEFRSVVDAVRCAVEVQTRMVERNARVSKAERIVFRIGVHVGDVVEENDGDLMGNGVNIAARLEGIATHGAICLSEDAYRQVKSRLELNVRDLGAIQLKNIAEPVRAYLVEIEAPKQRSASRHPLIAAFCAFAVVACAGGWYSLGGMLLTTPGTSATATAASIGTPVSAASPTTATPSAPMTADAFEQSVPIMADTGAAPATPPHTDTQQPMMPALTSQADYGRATRKTVHASQKRQLSKAEAAPSPSVESASIAPQSCILSVAAMNGNHRSCEYVSAVPSKEQPGQSLSGKSARTVADASLASCL